ncbi:MAG: hypothetical protein ACYDCN_01615 [Bacteroidia bacterium]
MRTLVINVDTDSSAKLFVDLAKKLHFRARILSDEEDADAGLLAMMAERKDDEIVPVSKTYHILRKVK